MRHALLYVGAYETNFPKLTTASTSFEGSDGRQYPYQPWPASADGLHISYMEQVGKNFVAVRVADRVSDVVLEHEMVLIPGQHFGHGVRLSAEATSVEDDATILKLLEDIIKRNPSQSAQLFEMRARLKSAMS